ncbi:hypothetical protein BGI33_09030 [Snodgrassella alvi]|uniref:Uncharacterized protein n=1 Tax=Snodgrassella alvi TaxID=1196083 RepID=A0A2N9WW43_9NEIS|nr:hypothetical protein BGI33_09030 [Snodgrassella alvi]PIT17770.1 hypothetical protein BGI34_06570 [Snodgrassella alvi]PIT17795.1 hypothetical protein BGI32_01730 [Snodgrassella alvi]
MQEIISSNITDTFIQTASWCIQQMANFEHLYSSIYMATTGKCQCFSSRLSMLLWQIKAAW